MPARANPDARTLSGLTWLRRAGEVSGEIRIASEPLTLSAGSSLLPVTESERNPKLRFAVVSRPRPRP